MLNNEELIRYNDCDPGIVPDGGIYARQGMKEQGMQIELAVFYFPDGC
jgi:hypothetical protein